jgi:hypothetical protein
LKLQYFTVERNSDKSEQRQLELDTALIQNVKNPATDCIHLLLENEADHPSQILEQYVSGDSLLHFSNSITRYQAEGKCLYSWVIGKRLQFNDALQYAQYRLAGTFSYTY